MISRSTDVRAALAARKRQRGFIMNPFGFAAAGDPLWANTSSLLHFEGANGSTTFNDAVGHAWTVEGNARIDTAQAKFGTSSGLFDGSGDRLVSPNNAAFSFGTGDFTVEFFVRPSGGSGADYFIGTEYNAPAWFVVGYDFSLSKFVFQGGGLAATNSGVCAAGQWYHGAVARASGQIRFFVNGVLAVGPLANAVDYSTQKMYVGGTSSMIAASGSWLCGNMDEVRITKGAARYTANFTPPSAAFPNA